MPQLIAMRRSTLPSGTTFTLPTFIETAGGVFLATHQRAPEALLFAMRSGRGCALPGIDDIVGPTAALVPLRVSLGSYNNTAKKPTTVASLLATTQSHQSDLIRHEHVGSERLLTPTGEHIDLAKSAVHINVTATPLKGFLNRLGMQVLDGRLNGSSPFGLYANYEDADLELRVYYDSSYVSADVSGKMLRWRKEAILALVEACDKNGGDVLLQDVVDALKRVE
jgi:hypothetical protein